MSVSVTFLTHKCFANIQVIVAEQNKLNLEIVNVQNIW